MGGLKSAFKSIKRFVKKNTKEIATIAGLFIPGVGPALGAGIGRGIGGLAEGEDLGEAAMAGASIYAGGKMLGGAGFGFDPSGTGFSGKFMAGKPGVHSKGIGGFFESIGANTFNLVNPNAATPALNYTGTNPITSLGMPLESVRESFGGLNLLGKAGAGAIAASGANSLSGGKLFDALSGGDDEPATMPGPIDQSGYLQQGLTPATLSDVYSTKGSGTGIAGSMPSLAQSYDYDPVNSTIAELLKAQDEYELEFPEFARVGMNRGGALGMSPAIQMGTDIQQLQPIMNDVLRPAPPMQIQPFPSLGQPIQQRRGAQGDVMNALEPVGEFIKGRLNTDEVDSTLQEFAQTIESKFPDNNGGGMQRGFMKRLKPINNDIGQIPQLRHETVSGDQNMLAPAQELTGIARLADGGELPEMDLREIGGDINDPEGSGDKDTVPALLADGEFVMTKQAVKGIGNGDHDSGIAQLYAMMDMNENKAQSMGLGRA